MLRIIPKSVVGIAAGYLAFRFFKKRNAEANEESQALKRAAAQLNEKDAALKAAEERLAASQQSVKELQAELDKVTAQLATTRAELATANRVNELKQTVPIAASISKTEAAKATTGFWGRK